MGSSTSTGAGSCTVTASQAGNGNYNAAPQVQRTFAIGKAALSITANDRQKFYAQPLTLGTSAFTPSGLVGSDSVSGVTLTSSGAGASARSGNYSIVPSQALPGPSTDLAANYTITYHNGTLHVLAVGLVGLTRRFGGDEERQDRQLRLVAREVRPVEPRRRGRRVEQRAAVVRGGCLVGSATSTQGSVSVASTANVSGNVTAGTTASILGHGGRQVTQHSPSSAALDADGRQVLPAQLQGRDQRRQVRLLGENGEPDRQERHGEAREQDVLLQQRHARSRIDAIRERTGHDPPRRQAHREGPSRQQRPNLPGNLHIDSSFTGSAGIAIAGGSHAAMKILAPRTTVTISGGSFFGTLFAATVKLTGTTAFHADMR